MSDLKLWAYYYSFDPTGQREIDLILHAIARAGKAFHHTDQWTEDGMTGVYDHCEGDTCQQWVQNAANKAAAHVAALREAAEGALHALESSRVFVTSRERCHKPDGEAWYDERAAKLRAALKGEP